jgi:dTDP-4-amino-4,6-dideoxygalactose transaminase
VDLQNGEVPLWTQAMSVDRERIQAHLEDRGIQLRPFNPCLADCDHLRTPGDFVNARRFASEGFTLPSGPDQPGADLEEVARILREVTG